MMNYPRLGTWIVSWPPSNKIIISPNAAILNNVKRPDLDTFRPIPSKFYENMKSDEFWGVMVRKYGLPATTPHSIVHVTATHGNGDLPTNFTSPVSSGKLPIWETHGMTKELERHRGPRTDVIREALLLTPDENRERKIELQLRLNDAHLRERTMFLDGESDFAYEHRLLWEQVRSPGIAGNKDDRDTTLRKLKDLLRCLKEEAERQSKEIARFMLGNDQDKDHRTYLEERNHLVRVMAQTFKQDHADKIHDKGIISAASGLIERLNVCLMMLHEENITPNLLQARFYDQTKAKMTPDTINSRIKLQPFAGRDDPAVRKRLLAEAYLAIDSKDATKCKTQAKLFLDHFTKFPFFCAVAQILMSYDGNPEHRNVMEYMDALERDSFVELNNDICPDKERADWHKVYKARIAELEAERTTRRTWAQVVGCAARDVDSDKKLAAQMNKIHLSKFGP
ncbi:hypothetical protein BDZ45DRAFT_50455 [Acephala macrosclerotiorum]|nr:hypothetical protein BDZ45DRAFT_50455 [Acephala macrosclerotiorum]